VWQLKSSFKVSTCSINFVKISALILFRRNGGLSAQRLVNLYYPVLSSPSNRSRQWILNRYSGISILNFLPSVINVLYASGQRPEKIGWARYPFLPFRTAVLLRWNCQTLLLAYKSERFCTPAAPKIKAALNRSAVINAAGGKHRFIICYRLFAEFMTWNRSRAMVHYLKMCRDARRASIPWAVYIISIPFHPNILASLHRSRCRSKQCLCL